ncbi:NTP transferase domain-containing protein [Microbacterium lacus]|uniref:molybdenum cofactor guanylyltransferase n=1 Tax=Microbacterium lacus TaxID=415217 RepID=UPI0038502C0D
MTISLGAILLAGGRGSRVGGATKPLFEIDGTTLLQRAVGAAEDASARPVTVVGPVLDPTLAVEWVREDRPFGGPAAAVVAALDTWTGTDPEWTLLLACDLPGVRPAVGLLLQSLPLLSADTEGLCLSDTAGRPQWLTGLYRTSALRVGANALPDRGIDARARALFDDLAIAVVAAPDALTRDIDSWEDLEVARLRAADDRSHS